VKREREESVFVRSVELNGNRGAEVYRDFRSVFGARNGRVSSEPQIGSSHR